MSRLMWVVVLGMLLAACGVHRVEDAGVDRTTIEVLPELAAVKVVAYGLLGNGCTSIGDVNQYKEGATFFITIKSVYNQPFGVGCTQAITEFREEVMLFTEGLAPGFYKVSVNGLEKTFTLP